MNPYKVGFVGAATNDATTWLAEQIGDAKKIVVPFAGSGKDIASMAGEGRTIESYDTQFYSRAIIEGVFAATEADSAVDKIRYRKGYMYETRALKNIDERSAGFIDWVAAHGTLFDKACLVSAAIRSTLLGRGNQWYSNIETFWRRFEKARVYNAQWINQPGEFVHHEASVFDEMPKGKYDLMQVDPPKVVAGSDVYSANFQALNKMLDGAVEPLPKWNWRDVQARFRELVTEVDVERIIFFYVSGVRPSYEEVKEQLLKYYDLEIEQPFSHRGRIDYALILRRK